MAYNDEFLGELAPILLMIKDKLSKRLNLKIGDPIAGGTEGIIFEIDKYKVIKISGPHNPIDINKPYHRYGKLTKKNFKRIVNIHQSGIYHYSHLDVTVEFIIMERLDEKSTEKIGDDIYEISLRLMQLGILKHDYIDEALDFILATKIKDLKKIIPNRFMNLVTQIKKLQQELLINNIKMIDFHPGQLCYNRFGVLKLIDVSDNYTDEIHKNVIEESNNKVICGNCSWEWIKEKNDSDPYLCHKCGYENKENTFKILKFKQWMIDNPGKILH
jgi:predicted RNA-binding Zn-ribbon protein involved in translation (DUF1610 family)